MPMGISSESMDGLWQMMGQWWVGWVVWVARHWRFTHSWPAITLHVLREWLRSSKFNLQVVLEVVIVFLFLC